MTQSQRIAKFEAEVLPYLPKCDGVTEYLKNTGMGFFEAPASTHYHGAVPGGLFEHSMCVMRQLVLLTERNGLTWERPESPWIVGFFHDLCKIDQYRIAGTSPEGAPVYRYHDKCLFRGHGDKSVILLSQLFEPTEEESACICYHMGAFTDKDRWSDYTNAIYQYPNVLWTHTADMIATYICDR